MVLKPVHYKKLSPIRAFSEYSPSQNWLEWVCERQSIFACCVRLDLLLLLLQSPPTSPRYRQRFNLDFESIRVGSLTVPATGSLCLSPTLTHSQQFTLTHIHMHACTTKPMEYYCFVLLWICSQQLGEWKVFVYVCSCLSAYVCVLYTSLHASVVLLYGSDLRSFVMQLCSIVMAL